MAALIAFNYLQRTPAEIQKEIEMEELGKAKQWKGPMPSLIGGGHSINFTRHHTIVSPVDEYVAKVIDAAEELILNDPKNCECQ